MAITKARRKASSAADGLPVIITNDGQDYSNNDPIQLGIGANNDSNEVVIKAKDPEGFPLTFDVDYLQDSDRKVFSNKDSASMPNWLKHPADITIGSADSSGNIPATYKFINRTAAAPYSQESDGSGTDLTQGLKFRFNVSDGLRTASIIRPAEFPFSADVNFSSNWNGFSSNSTNAFSHTSGMNQGSSMSDPLPTTKGKYYFEVKPTNAFSNWQYLMFGMARYQTFSGAYSGYGWSDTKSAVIYVYTMSWYTSNPGGASGITQWGQNDIINMAYDVSTTTYKVWMGRNGTFAGDPAAGTGGQTLTGTEADGVAINMTGGNGSGNDMIATIQKGQTLSYSPPSGFFSI